MGTALPMYEPRLYGKTMLQGGFSEQISGGKAKEGILTEGLYIKTRLGGRFCVQTGEGPWKGRAKYTKWMCSKQAFVLEDCFRRMEVIDCQ